MPIGTLDRSAIDAAKSAQQEVERLRSLYSGQLDETVEQIAARRSDLIQQLRVLSEERARALSARDEARATMADFSFNETRLADAVATAETGLADARKRLAALEAEEAEGRKRRDLAVELAAKQEAEVARLMGMDRDGKPFGGTEVPQPGRPVPELTPEVLDWVSNFTNVAREQTMAYFKAEQAKLGALIDLRSLRERIRKVREEIETFARRIADRKDMLATLRAGEAAARLGEPEYDRQVLAAKAKITPLAEELQRILYKTKVHGEVGAAEEAANATFAAAREATADNSTAILGALRNMDHEKFPKAVREWFTTTEKTWASKDAEVRAFKPGTDRAGSLSVLDRLHEGLQGLAKQIDTYAEKTLALQALNARRNDLRSVIGGRIDGVADRRNKEQEPPLDIKPGVLRPGPAFEEKMLRAAGALMPVIPKTLYPDIEAELDRLYDVALVKDAEAKAKALFEAAQKDAEAKAKAEAAAAELERLKGLDAIGAEPAFATLQKARRDACVAGFKKRKAETFTDQDLRDELTKLLAEQRKPDRNRWFTILGFPNGRVIDETAFAHSGGYVIDAHTTYYDDCISTAADGQIGVTRPDGSANTAAAIMKELFEDGVHEMARIHTSLELFAKDDPNNPRGYYKGRIVKVGPSFKTKIKTLEGADPKWVEKAKAHIATVLAARMSNIEARVKAWLDSDGAG